MWHCSIFLVKFVKKDHLNNSRFKQFLTLIQMTTKLGNKEEPCTADGNSGYHGDQGKRGLLFF